MAFPISKFISKCPFILDIVLSECTLEFPLSEIGQSCSSHGALRST